jgi:hypothetical protein
MVVSAKSWLVCQPYYLIRGGKEAAENPSIVTEYVRARKAKVCPIIEYK